MAARERFPIGAISERDGDLWLAHLRLQGPVLSLTRQANLDALRVDDRISTGRIDPFSRVDPDPLLDACGELSDALFDWWEGHPPAILYRSRTTPALGRTIAVTHTTTDTLVEARPLREAIALHAALVLRAGFEIPSSWMG